MSGSNLLVGVVKSNIEAVWSSEWEAWSLGDIAGIRVGPGDTYIYTEDLADIGTPLAPDCVLENTRDELHITIGLQEVVSGGVVEEVHRAVSVVQVDLEASAVNRDVACYLGRVVDC